MEAEGGVCVFRFYGFPHSGVSVSTLNQPCHSAVTTFLYSA